MADEVAVPARFEIEVRDLAYQHRDGAPLLARLYRPIGAGPFPALLSRDAARVATDQTEGASGPGIALVDTGAATQA